MTVQIVRGGAGRFSVNGELTFATARAALASSAAEFTAEFVKEPKLDIDLSAVTAVDSAGLALVIEWYRIANRAKKAIRFYGVPTQLVALAKIGDLDSLLPFEVVAIA